MNSGGEQSWPADQLLFRTEMRHTNQLVTAEPGALALLPSFLPLPSKALRALGKTFALGQPLVPGFYHSVDFRVLTNGFFNDQANRILGTELGLSVSPQSFG